MHRKETDMRYLLMVLGFLCVPLAVLGLPGWEPAAATGGALIVAGAVLFAIGGATCDIVDAIKGSTGPQER
jgi:hypothetical protein